MNRPLTLLAVGLASVGVLAACSPSETNFKTEGEKFLEEKEGDVATQTGYTFTDANCEKPGDTDTGTQYTCTATDDEGDAWEFTVEITGKRELTVQGGYSPKLVKQAVLQNVTGTPDESCVDDVIAGYDQDDLKAAFMDAVENDTPSDASSAIFQQLFADVQTQCVS